jgi:hypothetical protein
LSLRLADLQCEERARGRCNNVALLQVIENSPKKVLFVTGVGVFICPQVMGRSQQWLEHLLGFK